MNDYVNEVYSKRLEAVINKMKEDGFIHLWENNCRVSIDVLEFIIVDDILLCCLTDEYHYVRPLEIRGDRLATDPGVMEADIAIEIDDDTDVKRIDIHSLEVLEYLNKKER